MLKVSFFSYKGGAGRTSMLYNTVPYLVDELNATPENPIVIIDLDIDSKGLSYLLNSEPSSAATLNSVQVLKRHPLIENPFTTKDELFAHMMPVGNLFGLESAKNRAVLFIGAHTDETLNALGNYDGTGIDLRTFERKLSYLGCKALIMDNPTGGQLSADVALRISDKIVVAMRITKQFRDGTAEFLAKKKNFGNKEYIIVPNAVPSTEGTQYSIDSFMNGIRNTVSTALQHQDDVADMSMVEAGGICEVRLFKFEEANLRMLQKKGRTLNRDEAEAAGKYQKLAQVIINER